MTLKATTSTEISWPNTRPSERLVAEELPGLPALLTTVSALHRHLCPRQVLGLRMGIAAGQWLNLGLPQTNKRLIAIVETDGCFADGISVATNCWLGRRTLRLEDYGKVAATFIDSEIGTAVRLAPKASVRSQARRYAPDARNRWEAMLLGYQRMPSNDLFDFQPVTTNQPIAKFVSHASARATCDSCGEEILNEREVKRDGRTLCRACANGAYYTPLD